MIAINHSGTIDSTAAESSLLAELTFDQQTRLTTQLDRYLTALENGQPLDAGVIAAENPDIAAVFQSYLKKLHALYGVATTPDATGPIETLDRLTTGTTTLGDFTIQREIGRGGMGVVYEATQNSLSRRVAIKLLQIASLLDAQQIARFKNESYAAGLLQHPHIVPVYCVGTQRGVHYYAMQFIDGISLDGWLHQQHAFTQHATCGQCSGNGPYDIHWQHIIGWTIDIADALNSAHIAGVVHRDVKPSNLMLDQQGKIWITDFGLARCQSDLSLTRSGDLVGTVRYMSPEQAKGQHAIVDGRTDVYSLAATTYELLTGKPAHDGDDAPTLIKNISERDIPPLRQLRRDLPRDLETVLAKALSKSRDGRYDTASAFADDLRRVLAGQPTLARPATIVDHVIRFASKHRLAVLFAILIGLIGLVGLAMGTAMLSAEKQVSDNSLARAARMERLARGAVDRLGSQMAEQLTGIPAAAPVRRQLLAETLSYYQQFAASAGNDPELREDVAITFGKIGTFQSDLGFNDLAINALERSESIFAELARAAPRDKRLALQWSVSQNNLAQALATHGSLEQAASYFAKAIAAQEQLLTQSETSSARLQLATTLNNLGLLLAESQSDHEAERAYLDSVELLRKGVESSDQLETKQQLATVLGNLSGLLAKKSPERAVGYAREALTQQTEALQSDRGNVNLALQTIATLNTLGTAQSAAGQPSDAIRTFDQAIDIGQQLLARWPDQSTYRRDLVVSLNHLGLALAKTGDLDKAAESFQTAMVYGRPLAQLFRNDAETQSMIGSVLNNLGFLQQQRGDNESAAATFTEAIEAQSLAVELAPEVKRYRQYLRKHQQNQRTVVSGESAS
ncbi:protein kinase [Stieleria sp. TO1_6]|uniref:serine/threonine-protein kinase n=1 Tax=Stieleria tagensis TaxID=2956795 RepID=UPI00209AF360|nr:serine/threonine-protein kinase [Stieleria tagensis]MCO8123068.1 protein kinase [Stieleria tagensis]